MFGSSNTGLEIKKILRSPFGDQLEKYSCQIQTYSRQFLYKGNDAAHSMARPIRFDCLKTSRTEVSINLEVNWLCLCDLAHLL